MAWGFVQSNSGFTASNGSLAVSYTTANVQAGNKLVVAVVLSAGTAQTVTSVKDGALNAFTQVAHGTGTVGGFCTLDVWAIDVPAGDIGTKPTITAQASASTDMSVLVQEWSGLAVGNTVAAMVDSTPGFITGDTNTTTGSPTYSSSVANELLFRFYGDTGGPLTWTSPGPNTDAKSINTSSNADIAVAYGNSSGGTETGSWGLSGTATDWVVGLFAFKLAPAGGGAAGAAFTLPVALPLLKRIFGPAPAFYTPPIPSVQASVSANITGVAASVSVNGGTGVLEGDAIVAGVGASVNVNGGVGVPFGTIGGVGAPVSVAGGIGAVAGSANVTGVGASVNVQGGTGVTSGGANVTGVGSSVTVQGGIGTVAGSANVTGVGAGVNVNGGIGTPSGGAGVTGVGAPINVQGGVGTPAGAANVTGVGAPINVQGGVGVPFGGTSGAANVTGVGAAVNVNGGIGAPSGGAGVTGVGAPVNVQGGTGAPSGGAGVTGVGAPVNVQGGIGSPAGAANVTGIGAPVNVQGGVGTARGSANVTGIGAPVNVQGGVGTPAGAGSANVTGVAAAVAVNGGVGTPSGGASVAGTAAGVPVAAAAGVLAGGANVAGLAALVTVACGVGVPFGVSNIAIAGQAAPVGVAGGTGSVVGIVSGTGFGDACVDNIFDKILSAALATGKFDTVNSHEPKSAPGRGIYAAFWLQSQEPVRSSGQAATSSLLNLQFRVYQSFASEPFDAIELHRLFSKRESLHGEVT